MDPIFTKIFLFIVIVVSATIHEYSHAFIANECGDDTAKSLGRLTLNPLMHLDVFGSIIIPLTLLLTSGTYFGWMKPVPYNPNRLRGGVKDEIKVAAAGPISNFSVAFIIILVYGLFSFMPGRDYAYLAAYVNLSLMAFNLLPLPPLDGSKFIYPFLTTKQRILFEQYGIFGVLILLLFIDITYPVQALFQFLVSIIPTIF